MRASFVGQPINWVLLKFKHFQLKIKDQLFVRWTYSLRNTITDISFHKFPNAKSQGTTFLMFGIALSFTERNSYLCQQTILSKTQCPNILQHITLLQTCQTQEIMMWDDWTIILIQQPFYSEKRGIYLLLSLFGLYYLTLC